MCGTNLLRCIPSSSYQCEWHCSFRSELLTSVPHVPKYIVPRPTYVLMWRGRDLDDYSYVSVRRMINCTNDYPITMLGCRHSGWSNILELCDELFNKTKCKAVVWVGSVTDATVTVLSIWKRMQHFFALAPVWTLRWCSTRYAVKTFLRWDAFIFAWDAFFV